MFFVEEIKNGKGKGGKYLKKGNIFFAEEKKTRQSKQCGFSIYVFDNSKSKVGEDGLVWSGLC